MDISEVEETLLRVQSDFSWPVPAERFEVRETHDRSRSGARLFRVSGISSKVDLMVKSDSTWSGAQARAAHEALVGLRELFGAGLVEGAGFIESLGWSDSPALLVMSFVEASELGTAIRGDMSIETQSEYLRCVGAMLAAYHQSHRVGEEYGRNEAVNDVLRLARLLPGGSRQARRVLGDVANNAFYLYGDTTLGNVLLTSHGSVVMIDPPIAPKPGFPHDDIGNMLFDLRKKLLGFAATRSPQLDGYPVLRKALLSGYFAGNRIRAADEALISLFEFRSAAGTAKKRVGERSRDALWFSRQAAAAATRFLRYR